MASFSSDTLDNLFAAASGPVSHRDIQAAVAEDICSELHDFINLHRMTADKILHFNPLRSLAPGNRVVVSDLFDYSSRQEGFSVRLCFSQVFLHHWGI